MSTEKALLSIPVLLQEKVDDLLVKKSKGTKLPATAIITYEQERITPSTTYNIYVEKELVGTWPTLLKAFAGLLATYYVFDLAYPKQCLKTLTFLQKFVAKIPDDCKTPEMVLTFASKVL